MTDNYVSTQRDQISLTKLRTWRSFLGLFYGILLVCLVSLWMSSTSTKASPQYDALLLYDPANPRSTDINFQKVVEYYGLDCKYVDLTSTPLTYSLFLDGKDQYFPTAGIDMVNLYKYLDPDELDILKTAIDQHGVNLLVSGLGAYYNPRNLRVLTGGEITGTTLPTDSSRDYLLSTDHPDILRELSGVTVIVSAGQFDGELIISSAAPHVDVLVEATDDSSRTYPVFARYQAYTGSVFIIDSWYNRNLETEQFHDLYKAQAQNGSFAQWGFAEVVPLMVFVRYTAGDEAWHNDHNYANLTIDDPCLQEPYFNLTFTHLLTQMLAHDYHTTIATIPGKCYDQWEQSVVDLFLAYPDRYSLVIHGNNHEPCPEFTDRIPRSVQRALLKQALQRMDTFEAQTGIPYGRIMVFPCELAGESTLPPLKHLNFLATVNAQLIPLSGTISSAWDFAMYPAIMDYSNYAIVNRYWQSISPYPFDLFRDKPAFIYGHEWDFAPGTASPGIGAYNATVDAINNLEGEVEWRSLDYIIKRLYLKKRNDDGDIDVKWYTNHLILENETDSEQLYHLQKEEDGIVPIQSLTVNGVPYSYTLADGLLQLDVSIDGMSSAEIIITYWETMIFIPVILKQ
ncbi:MAG: hypothetical protein GY832_07305 [Chloroflexi bacterium]|nr:hypothetical protein [Chloroflexota bacterium]